MQKREKLLAIGLGSVVAIWLGLPFLEERFLEPLKDLERQEQALSEALRTARADQIALAQKDKQFNEWRAISLPPDPVQAALLYPEWLSNLAKMCGFAEPTMTAETRKQEGDTFMTIPFKLDSQATMQQLALFLERFESTQLLHRISKLETSSPATEGDPLLRISIVAEGVSILTAPQRDRIFAETELLEPISKDAREITVVTSTGFPKTIPFRIRIGNEFLNVTAVNGETWTVQRGVERTFANEHSRNATIEHFPLNDASSRDEQTSSLWTNSIFTKPAPQVDFRPQLAERPPPAVRGESWSWALNVSGWHAAFGSKTFELISGPPNLRLERNGNISWRVPTGFDVGEHPVHVLIWGSNGRDAGYNPTFNIRVRDPNEPPAIQAPESLRFFIGRESRSRITAKDPDGPDNRLRFALENPPAGMTINERSGEIRWTPPDSLSPQQLEIVVQVTDSDELAQTATARIPATLEEDSARFAYLTGIIDSGSDGRRAMIYDQATGGPALIVYEGETFQVADFDVTVERLERNHMIVRRYDQLYRWDFEQPIVSMQHLGPVPEAPPAENRESGEPKPPDA